MTQAFPQASIAFALSFSHLGPAAAAQRTVAVFDCELIDTSLEGQVNGPRADEAQRLSRLGDKLRRRLAESGRFSVVDMAPVAAKAHASHFQAFGGCDAAFAEELEADLAVTSTVQKVSNLILNVNVYVRDARTRKLVTQMSADMRGNTDESWSRTLDWLVRNRLLVPGNGVVE